MSLINAMLQDLEARTSGQGEEDLRRLVSGELRAARPPASAPSPWRAALLAACLAAVAALGWASRDAWLGYWWPPAGGGVPQVAAAGPVSPVPGEIPSPVPSSRPGPVQQGASPAVEVVVPADTEEEETPAGEDAGAVATASRVVKRPAAQRPALTAEALYARGAAALEAGRPRLAARALRQALELSPWHVEARELLAGIWLRAGRAAAARDLLREGLRRVPGRLSFALGLARLHLARGEDRQALEVLAGVQGRAGGDADYQGLLAAVYQRLGRHREAVAAYRAALKGRGEARWWAGLAISLDQLGRWGEARDAYRRADRAGGLAPGLAGYLDRRLAALDRRLSAPDAAPADL